MDEKIKEYFDDVIRECTNYKEFIELEDDESLKKQFKQYYNDFVSGKIKINLTKEDEDRIIASTIKVNESICQYLPPEQRNQEVQKEVEETKAKLEEFRRKYMD